MDWPKRRRALSLPSNNTQLATPQNRYSLPPSLRIPNEFANVLDRLEGSVEVPRFEETALHPEELLSSLQLISIISLLPGSGRIPRFYLGRA